MTEAEWMSGDSSGMLDWMGSGRKGSERKLRLFAVACCRRVWGLVRDERSRAAVFVAEAFADGLVDRGVLLAARDAARLAKRSFVGELQSGYSRAATAAFDATRDTGGSAASNAMAEAARSFHYADHNHCDEGELERQAGLLRCIFGSPFRPVAIEPSWRVGPVLAIATAIYVERSFDRLSELADALASAGCSDAEILDHCRSQGEHVRGCWVVDGLLGKA